MVGLLLEGGADVNKANNFGTTPLITASENGHAEVVRLMLNAGVDVNQANRSVTPLYSASGNGYTQVVEILLRNGAFRDARELFGETALDKARERNHETGTRGIG